MPVMLAERKPGVSIEVLELLVLQVEQLGEKCAKGKKASGALPR